MKAIQIPATNEMQVVAIDKPVAKAGEKLQERWSGNIIQRGVSLLKDKYIVNKIA